jgi:glycosyltransferase involved in cell wall biosynthesis
LDVYVIDERFRFDPQVIDEMRRVVKLVNPDLVQTHSVKSHFLLRLSGLSVDRPWIAFHHGYTDTDMKMRAYNQLDRWSLRFADRIVTVSRAFKKELEAVGVDSEKIRVVQNAVDQAQFRSAGAKEIELVRRRLGADDGSRLILSVGRLSREKGHVDLVEAFAKLSRSFPIVGTKLVIVGDGPERRTIENCAAAFGVQDQVVLTGQIRDVRPYYLLSDLLVLPSHSEGSPNVLLEAMAAGLPVVATRVGGVPEMVVHDSSALLVDPHRPDKMAASIAMLLADPDLGFRLAEAARRSVALHHSLSVRRRALTGIYRELVSEPVADPRIRSAV